MFDINPLLLGTKEYPMVALAKLKEDRLAQGLKVYDFGTGDPKIPLEPTLKEALVKAIPEIPQYPSVKGEPELIGSIQNYIKREIGVSIKAECILPTAGSKEAVYHLYPLLIHQNAKRKGVIYPDPGYPVYHSGASFHGGNLYPQVTSEKTSYQIDLSVVDKTELSASALAWVCNPHNPTGAVGDRAWLKKQIEVARSYGLLLCVDECYFEIYDQEKPPSVLSETDLTGILSFHSLSKRSGFTAFRSGFIAGDPELISHLKKMRPHFGVGSQTFVQHMAVAAWNEDQHAARRRAIFNDRRSKAADFLGRNGFTYSGKEATFYLWVQTPGTMSDEEYCRILFDRAGIIASPGTLFGKGGHGHFRLALVPTTEETEEAFSQWQKLIDDGHLPKSL